MLCVVLHCLHGACNEVCSVSCVNWALLQLGPLLNRSYCRRYCVRHSHTLPPARVV